MNPKIKRRIAIGFFIVVALLIYLMREILLPFIFSGIFVYLLAPPVKFLTSKKFLGVQLPRGVAVMMVFICFFLGLGALALLILPPLYAEVLRMAHEIPHQLNDFRSVTLPSWIGWVDSLNTQYHLNVNARNLFDQVIENLVLFSKHQVETIPANMQRLVKVLFSTLSTFLVVFLVTAFVLGDLPRIQAGLLKLVPARLRIGVLDLVRAIDRDLSGTIRGQLVICLINGTLTTIGLLLLQVKFAITIGFIAGVFSIIPVFGAVISSVPAITIALTQSLWTALAVIGVIILIHLIEANILNPNILGHTVELHPAIIVFSIIVGEHFFGPVGLLFGVPVAAIIRSVLRFFYLKYYAEPAEVEHTSTTSSGFAAAEEPGPDPATETGVPASQAPEAGLPAAQDPAQNHTPTDDGEASAATPGQPPATAKAEASSETASEVATEASSETKAPQEASPAVSAKTDATRPSDNHHPANPADLKAPHLQAREQPS